MTRLDRLVHNASAPRLIPKTVTDSHMTEKGDTR